MKFERIVDWWRQEEETDGVKRPEPALRSELFSAEQMESHGQGLAARHRLGGGSSGDRLLRRLDDNEDVLEKCCKLFSGMNASEDARISPAAEWLLDNFWLVEEQIRLARNHLPKGYVKELPHLAEGPSAGLPRVYDMALENISHGDGRLDADILTRFVAAYQTVSPLSLGELWAVPIMLRLALIENLRRVALRVMVSWKDQRLAANWAEQMIETAEKDRKNMVLTVAEMARSKPPMTSAFVAELARRLQGQSTALALPLKWIEELLAENGVTTDQLIQHDSQQQAADQVSISNSMNSLRQVGAIDWRGFVEELSVVEQSLRQDPAAVYPAMDFATRDHYRHIVEKLARKYTKNELEVARAALDLARAGGGLEAELDSGRAALLPAVPRHVGYYLLDNGREVLVDRIRGKEQKPHRYEICDMPCRASLPVYAGLVILLTLLITWPFLAMLHYWGWSQTLQALAVLPTLMVAGELALKLVNWGATLIYSPHFMPRLDFSEGIPESCRSLVVVPTMFGDVDDVRNLLEKIEVYYLANRDDNLQLGILGDFKDADREVMPGDSSILETLRAGIQELNGRYPGKYVETFFACHRPRVWNEAEGVWMGHERKRGKLCDFNALVRGHGQERFLLVEGNALTRKPDGIVPRVEYVITLDTDTQLPRDAARKLAGSMAHPLNRPVIDPAKQRVISGYGIMQPRVGITLPSATRSWYSRIFCFEPGIDPYTRAVSDVYQDLFCQGSYFGKGIYDLDAFEQAVSDRFPDNRILSHDLIESSYARSGLLSVVELYEDFPSTFVSDAKRRHRWVRGDWQLLPWIFPRVPVKGGGRAKNTLSALSRWKIADNLRRSMVPPALLALLLLGWAGSHRPVLWTVAVLAVLAALPVISAMQGMVRKAHDVSWATHSLVVLRSLGLDLMHTLLMLAWLPFEAWYCLDAAGRTLWRTSISHRRLLQWNPSHDDAKKGPASLPGQYLIMAACPLMVLVCILVVALRPETAFAVLPLALVWALGPALSWYMSRPIVEEPYAPSRGDLLFLRTLARKTWAFFDTYVGPQENWLPPDNMQEHPVARVAHRTSPTNMGMALLANLAAYDFGYLSATRLLERTDAQLAVMAALERHQGHFYNWYDTLTLQPLPPEYVSSVDSGNLAGHLKTLRPGLLALPDEPVFRQEYLSSLADAAEAAREALEGSGDTGSAWNTFSDNLGRACETRPASLAEAAQIFKRILMQAEALAVSLPQQSDGTFWLDQIIRQCRDLAEHCHAFSLPPSLLLREPALHLPTYRQLAEQTPEAEGEDGERGDRVRERTRRFLSDAAKLADRTAELAAMDFTFLFDPARALLAIGYNVRDQRLDASFYDLLASEARLTYYVGIADGQLPQKSWFSLGRMLTGSRTHPVLLSWSGSMFEYLMPSLVMPEYPGTLLDVTCKGAVASQVEYGRQKGVPWGISESGYSTVDADYNYQYRAFGVPGLGLKRGLGEDLVIAPYASVMAMMVAPEEACRNLHRLSSAGMQGRFGMYEAVDLTPIRLPRGIKSIRVRSFMAHHQGMSLLSLAYVLLDAPMQKRFLADPSFQATNLLLEERVPKVLSDQLETCRNAVASPAEKTAPQIAGNTLRVFQDPDMAQPAVQLLSNGRYHVMVSSGGGGYSRYNDLAVTRWREDGTRDDWGSFCYVRDLSADAFWSTSFQPTCRKTQSHEAVFTDARAEFKVREQDIDTHTEITVSPEDDVELRRVKITNRSREAREVELTSYAEVVLANPASDAQHQAFSKLFVQTELVTDLQALIASRRPSTPDQKFPLMFHLLAAHGVDLSSVSYETDRARFIGRGRSLRDPAAMDASTLSGTVGAVLDPIASIRCRMTLQPGQTATIDFVTGVAADREGCLGLMHKFRDRHLADRVFELAWTHSQVLLHQFNATVYDARLYEQLASAVVYGNGPMRSDPGIIAANQRGQSGLWGMGISGDNPIVLVRVTDTASAEIITQMVKAHAYWRRKGLVADLVIWHEDAVSYRQNLHDLILSTIPAGSEANLLDKSGGIFIRSAQQMSREDRILLQAMARMVITDTAGTLADQVFRRRAEAPMPRPCPIIERMRGANAMDAVRIETPELILDNGLGGFTPDGREYVIRTEPGKRTPAPWVNVIANPVIGTIASEAGPNYTWSENAYSFRLTPWHNDPVTDASGEAFYIRDEKTGQYFSPTPLPVPGDGEYLTRHGFGYTVYEHAHDGLASELTVFAAHQDPVKFSLLRLTNRSGRTRQLSATGYVEWVLGDSREKAARHVITESDPVSGTVFAHSAYAMDFPGRVAFLDVDVPSRSMTGDRQEFLGRNGSLASPAAMRRGCLSGRSGAGLDPCGAIQAVFELADGETREVLFLLGSANGMNEASSLCSRLGNTRAARAELEKVQARWLDVLGKVQVETPDQGVNALANGWLLYQSISSRYLGRSGYYQSGGAYGYRDQLQDVMAMMHAIPEEARVHILRSAAHQFPEGDVQHWWHPPFDRGVRTTCSDDFLWLPLAVSRYVSITGDTAILDEEVGYIEGRKLNPEEESYYDLPMHSNLQEPVYQHCLRAITHGFRRGSHNLPLIGGGDWNDGMSTVGEKGRGESVWLAFFQFYVMQAFIPLAEQRQDTAFVERMRQECESLREALESAGWDGEWYRRAYFDDGTPLGSSQNEECRIDSLSQSWSVLSGAAPESRAVKAMQSLESHLVRRDAGIIKLLTPPFDKSALEPGYIKGYVPGVRENGGQYTHAAIWAIMAFAAMGRGDTAWELLRMVNPVSHGDSPEAVAVYKVEPYVVSADVYAVAPHEGRGGWSWYTGAAGWLYRLITESLLGLHVRDGYLYPAPLLPQGWTSFAMTYRHGASVYRLVTRRDDGPDRILADGEIVTDGRVALVDDGKEHVVEVVKGR